MSDAPGSSRRSLWLKILVFCTPFIFLAIFAFFFVDLKTGPTTPDEVFIADGEFDNGERVEILDGIAAFSLRIDGREEQPFFTINSSSSSANGGSHGVGYSYRIKNGVVDFFEAEQDGSNVEGLILLLRILDTEGLEVVPKYPFMARENEVMELIRDADGFFDSIDKLPPGSTKEPEYTIDVEDGAGGWIRMAGPVAFIKDDGRAVALTSIYPRTNPELKIRVTRPDAAPVVLKIPTPGRKPATASPWKVDPKPWKQSLTDVDVELTELRKFKNPKSYPYPKIIAKAKAPGQADNAFTARFEWLEDESGNRASPYRFRVLPNTDKLRFHFEVGITGNYVWHESDVKFLAEGTWTGKEQSMLLKVLPEGENLDIQKAELEKTTKKDSWEIHLNAKGPNAKNPNHLTGLIFFLNGETQSNRQTSGYSGRSGGNGTSRYFGRDFRWTHSLSPGDTLKVGILPTYSPETFYFTLPVDASKYQPASVAP